MAITAGEIGAWLVTMNGRAAARIDSRDRRSVGRGTIMTFGFVAIILVGTFGTVEEELTVGKRVESFSIPVGIRIGDSWAG